MTPTNFSFLKNYFSWDTIPLDDESNPLCKMANQYIKDYYPDDIGDFPYASVFYEKSSNEIFVGNPTSSRVSNKEAFEFFLGQLPSLQLSDAAFFLRLIQQEAPLIEDYFQFSLDYPSPFCKEFLKDTYGYIVYDYQFMQLVHFTFRYGGTFDVLNEFRTGYNKRKTETLEKLENMYLPDGYNLASLLKQYTIKSIDHYHDYGFVIYPMHDEAYHFMACAEKYL
jgi:hypothetical protein